MRLSAGGPISEGKLEHGVRLSETIAMKKITSIVLLGSLLLAAPASAQNILIGLSTPMTGPAAVASEWERWGVDLAVEEINAGGGALGRKIDVMALDNKCNPSEGVNVANKLIEAKVVALVGSHCSSVHLAVMPIIRQARIAMITGIASNPQITTLSGVGGNEFAFRISPSDQAMMDALGKYLGAKKIFKTVAIVGEDTDFGRAGADAFKAVAEKAGMSIISTDFHPQNAPDYTSILTRLQQRHPDAVAIFQLGGDSLNFLRSAMQLGVVFPYTGRVELGGRNQQIIEAGGMEGSISAWTYSAAIDTPQNRAFAEKIKARHGSLPYLQTWGSYDSMRIIAQAIREAGSIDPVAVRDAMKKLVFTTVFGKEVTFDDHNQAGKYVLIQAVKDRKVAIAELVDLK
jgi:branched-chain amino acid transport system substrate-binding protein